MGTWLVGWLVNWFNSQLVGVRVTVRVDVPGHRGAADLSTVDRVCHLVVTADELARMQTKFVSSGSVDKVCLHRKSWQTNSADKL